MATNQHGEKVPPMKFPPGYGYPSYDDLKKLGEQSMFDSALTFILGVVVYGSAAYGFGVALYVFGSQVLQSI